MLRSSLSNWVVGALLLFGGPVLAQSQDNSKKDEGKNAQQAPAQSSSEKKADGPSRDKSEASKERSDREPTRSSDRRESNQSTNANRDNSQKDDRRPGARPTEADLMLIAAVSPEHLPMQLVTSGLANRAEPAGIPQATLSEAANRIVNHVAPAGATTSEARSLIWGSRSTSVAMMA